MNHFLPHIFITLILVFPISIANAAELEITPQQIATLGLKTAKVEKRSIPVSLEANGIVQADQKKTVLIAPTIDAVVAELKVVANDTVRKGQPLARLRSSALGQIQAEYLDTLAQFDVARAEQLRTKKLLEDGIIAENRWLEANSRYKSIQASLEQRRRQLSLAGLSELQINALIKHPERLSDFELVSPINGTILEAKAETGGSFTAGQTIFRIADLTTVWVDVRIPISSIAQLAPGQKVAMTTTAFPDKKFTGQLQSFSSEADKDSQTIKGRVVLENEQSLLRPGMYIQANLEGTPKEAIYVPNSALFRLGDQIHVFQVMQPHRFKPIPVVIGNQTSQVVEIKSGLEPGVEIVTEGVTTLKSQWQYQGGE